MSGRIGVVAVALVAIGLAMALVWGSAPSTGPAPGTAPAARSTPARMRTAGPRATPEAPVDDERVVPDEGRIGSRTIGPSTRPFESPEAAEAFVEDRVLGLFAVVAPEVDPKEIDHTCEPDGRICTFEGPWPDDGMLKRWVRAISDGQTGTEAMGGVKFSEFTSIEEDGRKLFRVVAHAP